MKRIMCVSSVSKKKTAFRAVRYVRMINGTMRRSERTSFSIIHIMITILVHAILHSIGGHCRASSDCIIIDRFTNSVASIENLLSVDNFSFASKHSLFVSSLFRILRFLKALNNEKNGIKHKWFTYKIHFVYDFKFNKSINGTTK